MKPLFIAGNWKSNKTTTEAMEWLANFKAQTSQIKLDNMALVLCVPFTLLPVLKEQIGQLPMALGAQDISPFQDGAYTGEVSGRQLREFCDWVIIGHSERRKNFGETDELLNKKVEQAKSVGLKIIYCVSDEKIPVPSGVDVVAYEPVWAIGTGKTDTPENAARVITSIKNASHVPLAIYGGSVTPQNVQSFVKESSMDGVLPGGASLDPINFFNLITACNQE